MTLQIKSPFYIDRRLRPTIDFSTLKCLNSSRNQHIPLIKKQQALNNNQCYSLRHSRNNSIANTIRQQKSQLKSLKQHWYEELIKKKTAIIEKNKLSKQALERVLQQLHQNKNKAYELMKHKCDRRYPCGQCKIKNMFNQYSKNQEKIAKQHSKTKSDSKLQTNSMKQQKQNKVTQFSSFNREKGLDNICQEDAGDLQPLNKNQENQVNFIKTISNQLQISNYHKNKLSSQLPNLLHKSLKRNNSDMQLIKISKSRKGHVSNIEHSQNIINTSNKNQSDKKNNLLASKTSSSINKIKSKQFLGKNHSRLGSKLIGQIFRQNGKKRKNKKNTQNRKLDKSGNSNLQGQSKTQSIIDIYDQDLHLQPIYDKNYQNIPENRKDQLKYNATTKFWDMEGTVNQIRSTFKPKQHKRSIADPVLIRKQQKNSTFLDATTFNKLKKSTIKNSDDSNPFRMSVQNKVRMNNINKRFRKGLFLNSNDQNYKTLISSMQSQSLRQSKHSSNSKSSNDISFDEQMQQKQQQQTKKKRKNGKYRSGYIFSKYQQEKIVYKIMKKQLKVKDSSNKEVRKVRMSVPTIAFYQVEESLDEIEKIEEEEINQDKEIQDAEYMKGTISELNATFNSKKHLKNKISDEQAFKIFLKKISLEPHKLKIFKQQLRQYLQYHSKNRNLFHQNFRFFKYLQRNLQQSSKKQKVINDKMAKNCEKQLNQIQKVMQTLQDQLQVPEYNKLQYSNFFLSEGMEGGYSLHNYHTIQKGNSSTKLEIENFYKMQIQQLMQISMRQISQDRAQQINETVQI